MSGDPCLAPLCPPPGAKPSSCSFKAGSPGNKYVRLNVGGSLYYTTVQVLTRHDTMLKAMFSGRMEVLSDKEGKRPAGRQSFACCPEHVVKSGRGQDSRWNLSTLGKTVSC